VKFIGIAIFLAGAVLLYEGISRQNSVVGQAATAATDVANSVDGGTRTPLHVTYIVGGGALMAVGAFLSFRSNPNR
jgi:hypothetical protein